MKSKAIIIIATILLSANYLSAEIVTAGKFEKIYDPSVGESEKWYINDHCFIFGNDNQWHMFGITHAEPLNPMDEDNFAHATANTLNQNPWQKEKYALSVDESLGETHLWAPHVIENDGTYYMYYCGGGPNKSFQLNLATSTDLYNWKRNPQNPLFTDGYDARDPFILKDGNQWIMYYTATDNPQGGKHIVAYRTSTDLLNWSERKIAFEDASTGTYGGPTESPTVIRRGKYYYLFIGPRASYRGTCVYRSDTPHQFKAENIVGKINSHAAEVIRDFDGKWYVSHCGWGQAGVYLSPLNFNDGVDENDTSLDIPKRTKQKSTFKNFVTTSGSKLIGDNCKELKFVSYNIPCIHYNEDNMAFKETNPWRLTNEFEITDALEAIRQIGGNVVRTYTLSVRSKDDTDNIPRHILAPGKFNEQAFIALDKVLQIANQKGVRVIIPFIDNWKWWGGVEQYAAFRGKPRDEFWTDPQLKADFKKTIEFLINRTNTLTGIKYKDDPAILAWETGNELICPHTWTSEMAKYIKSLDSNHLVLDGYHTTVLRKESINDPAIDIVTTHHYECDAKKTISNIKKSLKKVGNKKPYFIGEFGFVNTKDVEKVIDTVIENNISGILMWSLRFRNRDGGFYWHSEPAGGDKYKAYHWPGFDSGRSYDEKNFVELIHKKAFQIQGKTPHAVTKPAPPKLLPITDAAHISWQGSTGAQSYKIEKASSPKGPWKKVAENITDAHNAYSPLFNDTTVKRGQQLYYRVSAKNKAGLSKPSNIVGPVKIKYVTLVDEMKDFSLINKQNGKLSLETKQSRKFKEDFHRLKANKKSFITYKLDKPINSWTIYTFFEKDISDFKFYLSSDGKNFTRSKAVRQDFFAGQGEYNYAKPVSFTGYSTIKEPVYLKIEFTTDAQISRVEIKYDTAIESSHTHNPAGFIKGFSWGWTGWRGQYLGEKPGKSMAKLADTGANWVCISFGSEMDKFDEPIIYWSDTNPKMVTDNEIRHAINLARQNKLKVILKPAVNVRDTTWRAWIKFNNSLGQKDLKKWDQWWSYFEKMVLHYAVIAEQKDCEMFCPGCEMESTEGFEDKWRTLIAKIREVYSGIITYNCNHGRQNKVKWLDATDMIGISGYYPVGADSLSAALQYDLSKLPASENTIEKIKKRWLPIKKELKQVSKKFDKPIFFIELGVCSAKGFSAAPWTHHQPNAIYDGAEQARFYESALETFWEEPWFVGFAWWAWLPNLYTLEEAKTHTGFCIYGKEAEQVIRKWYNKER